MSTLGSAHFPEGRDGTLQQTRFLHTLGPIGEGLARSAPTKLVDILEKRRVDSESCESLEEQREIALVAKNLRREIFDSSVLVQKPRGGDSADPGDARVAVGGVADQGEIIGNEPGLHAEFLPHARRIANGVAFAV